jgi:hypothetical protein
MNTNFKYNWRIFKACLYEFNVSPAQLHSQSILNCYLTSVTISSLGYGGGEYSKLCQGLPYFLVWNM